MKVATGSISWIATSFGLGLFFLLLYVVFSAELAGFIFLLISVSLFVLSGFFVLFFRDPERTIGDDIVACADGKIREVKELTDEEVGQCTKISTFMNIYNVHVNRMPLDGTIKNIVHIPGAHIPAFNKDSDKNERAVITVDTSIGTIKIIQIAGTLARRIVPYVKKEDKLKKGQKIGLIRLGSRVDLYLPTKKLKKIYVKPGDTVIAGVDALAKIND